ARRGRDADGRRPTDGDGAGHAPHRRAGDGSGDEHRAAGRVGDPQGPDGVPPDALAALLRQVVYGFELHDFEAPLSRWQSDRDRMTDLGTERSEEHTSE